MAPGRLVLRSSLVCVAVAVLSLACSSTSDRMHLVGQTATREDLIALLGPPHPLLDREPEPGCADQVAFRDVYDSPVLRWFDDRLPGGGASGIFWIFCLDDQGRRIRDHDRIMLRDI